MEKYSLWLLKKSGNVREFSEKKNGWWTDPCYLKFWVRLTPLE